VHCWAVAEPCRRECIDGAFQSPATIARLLAAKSVIKRCQSAVSTIDPIVEQIGHASAG